MRLIDADEVIKHLEKCIAAPMFDNDYRKICFAICNYIDGVSTIEAEPVKRGQWIHHAGMNSKCSCCGRYFPVAEFEQRPFDVNFCIHCGARMDGGDENA